MVSMVFSLCSFSSLATETALTEPAGLAAESSAAEESTPADETESLAESMSDAADERAALTEEADAGITETAESLPEETAESSLEETEKAAAETMESASKETAETETTEETAADTGSAAGTVAAEQETVIRNIFAQAAPISENWMLMAETVYTVHFDANGGEDAPDSIITTKKTITLPTKTPTRSGYIFKGWAYESSAEKATPNLTSPGWSAPINFPQGSTEVTLYAVWEKSYKYSYSVTLYGNYPVGNFTAYQWVVKGEPQMMSVYSDTRKCDEAGEYTVALPSITHNGNEYTLKGWGTSSDSQEIVYSTGDSITIPLNDETPNYTLKLWGIWKEEGAEPTQPAEETYTLHFDTNTAEVPSPSDITKKAPANESASFELPSVEREGYVFKGWSEKASWSEEDPIYRAGESYTSTEKEATLYAVWEPLSPDPDPEPEEKEFTLIFHSNDGNNGPSRATVIGMPGATVRIRLPEESESPTIHGNTFLGWALSRDAGELLGKAGEEVEIALPDSGEISVTLYAVWEKTYTFRVVFDPNGGAFHDGSAEPRSREVTSHRQAQTAVFQAITNLKRDHYVWKGWSRDPEASENDRTYNNSFTVNDIPFDESGLVKELVLYAVWEEAPDPDPADPEPQPEPEPEKKGDTYTIHFDANADGVTGVPEDMAVTVTTGSKAVGFVVPEEKPALEGKVFMGWATFKFNHSPVVIPGEKVILVTTEFLNNELTYYAIWGDEGSVPPTLPENGNGTHASVYTYYLYYDANGGENPPERGGWFSSAREIEVEVDKHEPTRDGYIFKGWARTADAAEALYHGGDTIAFPADLTAEFNIKWLYAVWEKAPDKPEIPTEPDKPEIPTEPDKPEIPTEPDKPETPTRPTYPTPVTPSGDSTAPGPGNSPIEAIPDNPMPLSGTPEEPVMITDEDTPLAAVPQTGDDRPVGAAALFGLAALAMMGTFGVLGQRKKETDR